MKKTTGITAAAIAAGLAAFVPSGAHAAPGMSAKVCTTCHKTVEDNLIRGHWEDLSWKFGSVQVKVDALSEVVAFDKAALELVNPPEGEGLEKQMRGIKKGAEVSLAFVEKDGKKVVSKLTVKPKLKVADEKLLKTADIEKLVEKGTGYFLFDARPGPPFQEGFIPTAVSLPFPAWDNAKGKLPADKSALVVFYCSGVT
jgi:hypothetical protein